MAKEDLRIIFCCIEQSSFNLINSKKKILHYYFIDAVLINIFNTRIHNLIFVPQITQFLLADAIISSKTRVVEARSRRDAIEKVKNNKTISTILSFIQVLHLKQQSNILQCFYSLKFQNNLFRHKLSNCIFRSKTIVYTTKKVHIKYFVQNWPVKRTFFYLQTVVWLCRHCYKFRLFRFMEHTIQGTPVSWDILNHKWPSH